MTIDITKLKTAANYAQHLRTTLNKPKLTIRTVYNMISDGRIKSVEIDGFKFVIMED